MTEMSQMPVMSQRKNDRNDSAKKKQFCRQQPLSACFTRDSLVTHQLFFMQTGLRKSQISL